MRTVNISGVAINYAISEMPLPFYQITVSSKNSSLMDGDTAIKNFTEITPIRVELKTDKKYSQYEWSIALCLKDKGDVNVLDLVKFEGA